MRNEHRGELRLRPQTRSHTIRLFPLLFLVSQDFLRPCIILFPFSSTDIALLVFLSPRTRKLKGREEGRCLAFFRPLTLPLTEETLFWGMFLLSARTTLKNSTPSSQLTPTGREREGESENNYKWPNESDSARFNFVALPSLRISLAPLFSSSLGTRVGVISTGDGRQWRSVKGHRRTPTDARRGFQGELEWYSLHSSSHG